MNALGPSWRRVAGAESLAAGQMVAGMIAGVRLVVGRAESGPFALDGICPHAGAVLAEGLVDGDLLICPLHAFAFDVKTGICIDDATCSVRRHPVREREEALEVEL